MRSLCTYPKKKKTAKQSSSPFYHFLWLCHVFSPLSDGKEMRKIPTQCCGVRYNFTHKAYPSFHLSSTPSSSCFTRKSTQTTEIHFSSLFLLGGFDGFSSQTQASSCDITHKLYNVEPFYACVNKTNLSQYHWNISIFPHMHDVRWSLFLDIHASLRVVLFRSLTPINFQVKITPCFSWYLWMSYKSVASSEKRNKKLLIYYIFSCFSLCRSFVVD